MPIQAASIAAAIIAIRRLVRPTIGRVARSTVGRFETGAAGSLSSGPGGGGRGGALAAVSISSGQGAGGSGSIERDICGSVATRSYSVNRAPVTDNLSAVRLTLRLDCLHSVHVF